MVFNWKWLIVAIIIFGAITSSNRGYGKWIFSTVMIGVLLMFGDKIKLPDFK
jgi:hypothetical protein